MARELDRIIIKDKNVTYLVNPFFFKDEVTAEFLEDYFNIEKYQLEGRVIKEYSGRGTAYLLTDVFKNRVVMRHYWRGGKMYKILKDKFVSFFASSKRAEQEFEILQTLKKMGLSVPKPVAARYVKKGFFVTNDIILQEIPGAKSLAKILSERRLTNEEFAKIGDAIGKLMLAGVFHTDLNINNILLDGANNIWIIDFDKCYLKKINKKIYVTMMERLERSFDKEVETNKSTFWQKSDFQLLRPIIKNALKRSY
jgi:RIO-like serine/threonine protein kinase